MNMERFRDVIKRLRLVKPEQFNISFWLISPDQDVEILAPDCNSAGCVLGWCCTWYEGWTYNKRNADVRYHNRINFSAAAEFFDIPYRDAHDLFSSQHYRHNVTPNGVANNLECYCDDVNRSNV